MARPRKHDRAAVMRMVCERIAQGERVHAACAAEGIRWSTLWVWKQNEPEFAALYARARGFCRIVGGCCHTIRGGGHAGDGAGRTAPRGQCTVAGQCRQPAEVRPEARRVHRRHTHARRRHPAGDRPPRTGHRDNRTTPLERGQLTARTLAGSPGVENLKVCVRKGEGRNGEVGDCDCPNDDSLDRAFFIFHRCRMDPEATCPKDGGA